MVAPDALICAINVADTALGDDAEAPPVGLAEIVEADPPVIGVGVVRAHCAANPNVGMAKKSGTVKIQRMMALLSESYTRGTKHE
jgi:hypothetical protein